MNGKEPGLQTIGWLMAVALALLLIMAAASCSSHRNVNTESTVFMETVDSAEMSIVSTTASSGWCWHTAALDSLRVTIRADSITTPDGATLHRPSIDVEAVRPVISSVVLATEIQDDTIHTETFSTTAISTDESTPPKESSGGGWSWKIFLLILLLIITFIAAIRKLHKQ